MSKDTSAGRCNACGNVFDKASMTRHLKSCLGTQAIATEPPARIGSLKTLHLLAEGHYASGYWLHLDVPAGATLEALDRFLRRTWLECCGHMSAFTIEDVRYSVSPSGGPFFGEPRESSMKKKLCDVLSHGLAFLHEYDFGTTTVLKLKVIAERKRAGNSTNIEILARNDPPAIKCESCGKLAAQVCSQCLWESPAWFCEQCAEKHECGEEMLLPVVNSPRVGMCGYCG